METKDSKENQKVILHPIIKERRLTLLKMLQRREKMSYPTRNEDND